MRRWEREAGLPRTTAGNGKRGIVYAYKAEIDAWRESRSMLLAAEPDEESVLRPTFQVVLQSRDTAPGRSLTVTDR